MPNGTTGTPYNQSISAVCEIGGTSTITLFSGALPTGLIFTAGTESVPSTISGTPTTSGNFNFSVRLTNTAPGEVCPTITIEYIIVIGRKNIRRRGGALPPALPEDIYFNIQEFDNYIAYVLQNGFPKNATIFFDTIILLGRYLTKDNAPESPREPSDPTPPRPPQRFISPGGSGIINISRGIVPSQISYYGVPYNFVGGEGYNYHYKKFYGNTLNQRIGWVRAWATPKNGRGQSVE